MKQQLVNDFQAVGAVTSDPRLINHNLSPSAFGMPKGTTGSSPLSETFLHMCTIYNYAQ